MPASSSTPRPTRRSGRSSLLLHGLLLAASLALVASKNAPPDVAGATAGFSRHVGVARRRRAVVNPKQDSVDDKASVEAEEGDGDIDQASRYLKKTDDPTMMPTDEPKKKPKKTDAPTMVPTIFRPPTVPDTLDTPSPAGVGPTATPTESPTISPQPTDFPSASPTRTTMPTSFPTGTPSASPSAEPTAVPSASPTVSAMPSMAPIPYMRSDRVDLRYQPWTSLTDEQRSIAALLDYDEATWDEWGTNPIEGNDWSRLDRQQKNAARSLGYDVYSWDCWQNHFQGYRYIDLDLPYTQAGQWWKALGWDIYSWNQYEDAPPSDSLSWYELSEEERYAAAQLCYFRTSWDEGDVLIDGFPIERPEFRYTHWTDLDKDVRAVADERLKYSALTWNVLNLGRIEAKQWMDLTPYESEAAEIIGFTQLNWDCWQNHFRSYSWDDLYLWGLDVPYAELGWTELSWDGIEAAPASASMTWKELTPEERRAASGLCYFRDNWDGVDMTPNNGAFPFPKVKERYVEWDALPTNARVAAAGLEYTEQTWNNLGTAEIEQKSWEQLTEAAKARAMTLGFYQRTWDCFLNHYRSYEWNDIDRDSRDALQFLGWSETSWNQNEEPASYANEWARLSDQEQLMANDVCFFEDNWDGNDLETVVVVVDEPIEDNGSPAQGGQGGTFTDLGGQTQTPTTGGGDQGAASGASNASGPSSSVDMVHARRIVSMLSAICGALLLG